MQPGELTLTSTTLKYVMGTVVLMCKGQSVTHTHTHPVGINRSFIYDATTGKVEKQDLLQDQGMIREQVRSGGLTLGFCSSRRGRPG